MQRIDRLFKNIDVQKVALDGTWLRNEAIANNMANVNTPGYKRQDVAFESILQDYLRQSKIKMETTHSGHMTIAGRLQGDLSIDVTTNAQTSFRKDQNNVDLDTEMAEMTKNSLHYNAVASQVSSQFRRIKMAVTEGR